ncbi:ABC transporter ATP-binding protein [Candidatus Bathyarchaeota archaeon]|nr:MAG: ABC transporter ATP-binding protein [Candidatus Bathyarchaeota archaeon]
MLIVRTLELTRIYRLGSSRITAINKVNLEVDKANLVAIIGPSGSGKTTLLHLIGLNDHPTFGKVFINEKDTSLLAEKERRKIRLQNIGFVFQTFNLLPTLTALENVELPMALANISQETQRRRAVQLLETVGLASRLQHRPKELSTGEMQRVAIARALANSPSLILADEPTGELDSETGFEIIKLLSDLCRKQKAAVIVVTHDEKMVEFADVTYRIRDGSITQG